MATILGSTTLLVADADSVLSSLLVQDWGIFKDVTTPFGTGRVQVVGQNVGNFLINVTGLGSGNFLDMAFRISYENSKYPVEQGAFQSYNKVQKPYDVATTVTAGGTNFNRATLLKQIEAIIGTTDLYTVLTPEEPITGLNPVGYAIERRHDRGLGLLMVEIFWEQVRPAGDPTFSTTQTPNSPSATSATAPGETPITNPTPAFASATSQSTQGVVSPSQASGQTESAISVKLKGQFTPVRQ